AEKASADRRASRNRQSLGTARPVVDCPGIVETLFTLPALELQTAPCCCSLALVPDRGNLLRLGHLFVRRSQPLLSLAAEFRGRCVGDFRGALDRAVGSLGPLLLQGCPHLGKERPELSHLGDGTLAGWPLEVHPAWIRRG